MIRKCLTNRSPGPNGFTDKLHHMLRKESTPILLKLLPKEWRGKILPRSFYEANFTLITKPDKDTTHKKRKENYRPISLMNTDAKILQLY